VAVVVEQMLTLIPLEVEAAVELVLVVHPLVEQLVEMGEVQILLEEQLLEILLVDKVVMVEVMDTLIIMNFIMVAVQSTVEVVGLVLVMGLIALIMRATPISLGVLLSLEPVVVEVGAVLEEINMVDMVGVGIPMIYLQIMTIPMMVLKITLLMPLNIDPEQRAVMVE